MTSQDTARSSQALLTIQPDHEGEAQLPNVSYWLSVHNVLEHNRLAHAVVDGGSCWDLVAGAWSPQTSTASSDTQSDQDRDELNESQFVEFFAPGTQDAVQENEIDDEHYHVKELLTYCHSPGRYSFYDELSWQPPSS